MTRAYNFQPVVDSRFAQRALRLADDVDCASVVVDAKPEAVAFYRKFGFVALDVAADELGDRPLPLPMCLELGQLRSIVHVARRV